MNLYVINQKFRALLALADEHAEQHGGNIDDIMIDQLVNASETLGQYREDAILAAKEKAIFADSISEEIKRLEAVKKKALAQSESLIALAVSAGAEAHKTAQYELKMTRGESVIVDDIELLSERFIRTTTKRDADKVAIKKAIKAGKEIIGAHIEHSENWKVK